MTPRWRRETWTRGIVCADASTGFSMRKLPPVKDPGKVMEEALQAREPHLRPMLLQAAERHAKETGDFEMMRAVKEYRDKSREIHPLKM